jgi:hypothetical protein
MLLPITKIIAIIEPRMHKESARYTNKNGRYSMLLSLVRTMLILLLTVLSPSILSQPVHVNSLENQPILAVFGNIKLVTILIGR